MNKLKTNTWLRKNICTNFIIPLFLVIAAVVVVGPGCNVCSGIIDEEKTWRSVQENLSVDEIERKKRRAARKAAEDAKGGSTAVATEGSNY